MMAKMFKMWSKDWSWNNWAYVNLCIEEEDWVSIHTNLQDIIIIKRRRNDISLIKMEVQRVDLTWTTHKL
jgi:hypothetical protein